MSTTNLIEFEKNANIGIIRFNNPPLNIGNKIMAGQLSDALGAMENDPTVHVVIFCAVGRAFGAGSDMKELLEYLDTNTYVDIKMINELRVRDRIANLPMPTIAALDAPVYGGGLETILACDMRIAASNVILSMPEVDIGSFPGAGGGCRLVRLIGPSRAAEFLLFGEPMNAQKALEWGMINAIADQGTALELAMEWAKKIAAKPQIGTRTIKENIMGMILPDMPYLNDLQQKISRKVADAGNLKTEILAFFERKKKS